MGNDFKFIGESLYNALQQLGENVYFVLEDGTKKYTKMCISDKVSSNQVNPTNIYEFVGEMAFDNVEEMEFLKGSYFKREIYPEKTYILISTTENPFSNKFATVKILECNKIIDIGYETKIENDSGGTEIVIQKIYENVSVFAETNTKAPQQTKVGDVPRTVTSITMPCDYKISEDDIIIIKNFERDKNDINNVNYIPKTYSIISDSVSMDFMNTFDGKTFFGVINFDVIKRL